MSDIDDMQDPAYRSMVALGRAVAEGAKARGNDVGDLLDDDMTLTEEEIEQGRVLLRQIETETGQVG